MTLIESFFGLILFSVVMAMMFGILFATLYCIGRAIKQGIMAKIGAGILIFIMWTLVLWVVTNIDRLVPKPYNL